MIPIKPESLCTQPFSKTASGYDTNEVDDYIQRLTENYSLLYRENAALLKQLRETSGKLNELTRQQALAQENLQKAQAQSDKIIEDAYIKADDILASVQMNCDSILRHFKEKAEMEEKALAEMKKNILKFKNDLFEQYRTHIEWIENIFPEQDGEQNWTPDAYAQHIVLELKRKISAQYGIFPESETENNRTEKEAEKTCTPEGACSRRTQTRKKNVKKTPTVMELIEEYEDHDARLEEKSVSEQQFMLDFDHPSVAGVTMKKKK
ncbi:MAG: DivIVA domain-containing protein [Clostridia bacterium]|nr:DivIVA domain-containing protein [Clostridia bacterium]